MYSVYNEKLSRELGQNGQPEGHTAFEERWVGTKENRWESSPFCPSHKERIGNRSTPKERLANRYFEEHRKAGKR